MKKKYGLIGYPLEHSFSKDFFNRKFMSENVDAEYLNFQIGSVRELGNVLRENPLLCGLNVTLPYKTQVMALLDELDGDARTVGAVNVIKFVKGRFGRRKLKGYNSDIIGFRQSVAALLDGSQRSALVLGTGGAAKAVVRGLEQLGVTPLPVSRTKKEGCLTYGELTPRIMEQNTVIVNTTPVGMYPNVGQRPDIPYDLLTPGHLLYDLLYNPDETAFLRAGKERGCTVKNGLEMLILQAYESWKIWNM
ncbi:MAG: shikimate dehydrogenase [Tannerella sp.]|jgi:shikimate dehydrogenase|nr:shikimate dehydrogenase [Tannerella sp.]